MVSGRVLSGARPALPERGPGWAEQGVWVWESECCSLQPLQVQSGWYQVWFGMSHCQTATWEEIDTLVEQKGPRHRLYSAEVQPRPGQPHPLPLVASLPFPISYELLGESGQCWGGRSLFLFSWLIEALTALLTQEQQLCILLSINLIGSWEVTSGLRVKQQHGINLKTTAFIFSSVLEKPVWLMLVMTQQNLS